MAWASGGRDLPRDWPAICAGVLDRDGYPCTVTHADGATHTIT